MYKIKFVRNDDKCISFDNVINVKYGKDLRDLSSVEDHSILNHYFSPHGFYQLITTNSNVCYHDQNTEYVEIIKLED